MRLACQESPALDCGLACPQPYLILGVVVTPRFPPAETSQQGEMVRG